MSEQLIYAHTPDWTGGNEYRHFIEIPAVYFNDFTCVAQELYDISIPFTHEKWNGRIQSCRGVGATLSREDLQAFDKEHLQMLQKHTTEVFNVLHYATYTILKKR